MRLFPIQDDQPNYINLSIEIYELVRETVYSLQRISPQKREEVIQLSMFLIHVQAKIVNYHNFDRFVYAQAAILLGGKLIDQIQYTTSIVTTFRACLRKMKQRGGTDTQIKIKSQIKKVDEAQINLMINLGFDLQLESGMNWFYQWKRNLGDDDNFKKAAVKVSELYQTSLCIYYDPQILALTGLYMCSKSSGLTAELMGWKGQFLSYFNKRKEEIEKIYEDYTKRLNNFR